MIPLSEALLIAIIPSLFTFFGVVITVYSATKKQTAEVEKSLAVMRTEMAIMKEDIKSHNQYAKMFAENIPAINQHMQDVDRRLTVLEGRKQ